MILLIPGGYFQELGKKEVESKEIGEKVLTALRNGMRLPMSVCICLQTV
jgi:hypothetical protein